MLIELEPYFKKLSNYYWDNLDPVTDGSIWEWLERDFKARRTIHFPCGTEEFYSGRKFDLEFKDDKDATYFLLRWS